MSPHAPVLLAVLSGLALAQTTSLAARQPTGQPNNTRPDAEPVRRLAGQPNPESAGQPTRASRGPEPARGVIFIQADGMGVAMLSGARTLTRNAGPLAIESMPATALVITSSATGPITDSAAGATAYATGVKVPNRAVGMDASGRELRTILEEAESRGLATAILTTTDLTDASPAAFVASVPKRSMHEAIFEQMTSAGVDVLVGGLRTASLQAEPTAVDPGDAAVALSARLRTRAESEGYAIAEDFAAFLTLASDDRPILFSPPQRTRPDAFGPALAESLRVALEVVSRDPDGFFVFAEVEETDSAGHANDLDRALAGVREADDALRVALEFQKRFPDTLIVLTADHDTGGLSVTTLDYAEKFEVRWASDAHTDHLVPLFASGPGQRLFAGVIDNTDVPRRIARSLGWSMFDGDEFDGDGQPATVQPNPEPKPPVGADTGARPGRRGVGDR
jgi:alkaline phosphatase